MYLGVSNGVLIVAGGANYDETTSGQPARKLWYDHIYVLEKPAGQWKMVAQKLPRPLAYGVSVSDANGLVCIGGRDADQCYSDVFMLKWLDGRIELTSLAPLPRPRANMCGAILGSAVYVAGGVESPHASKANQTFWALDLSAEADRRNWTQLEPWPGPGRSDAVASVQDASFFVMAGTSPGSYLQDCYRYTPGESHAWAKGRWTKVADLPYPLAMAPTPAPAVGLAHLLILGGVTGEVPTFTGGSHAPTFLRDILAYHTTSDSWVKMGQLPNGVDRFTAPATKWRGMWVVRDGESSPGAFHTVETRATFGWANWSVLGLYLAVMLGVGVYFSKREKSTRDFFLAGGRVPWWAAGLSIYGTQLSGITFLAIPQVAFLGNWAIAIGSVAILAVAPVVIYFYLPFFRRLNITTAYEYLEKRFNISVRLFGTVSFLLFQVARMGIVLFLPAIALSAVTGINIYVCIAVMGAFCVVYTVLGGIEAVIWTDVLQVLVLMGGAIVCLIMIITNVDGGLGGLISVGLQDNKFETFDWGWDYSRSVVWVMVIGFFFLTLTPYTSDQTVIQRYLTTRDENETRKSIWTNAVLTIPALFIFFGLGTALYVFYKTNPGAIAANQSSEIVPWFIVQNLPVGVAGLVIAAVFAATMSSLDSSMNSMATVYVTDFHRRFRRDVSDRACLRLARWLTVLFGMIGTGTAILLAATDIRSLFEFFNVILGMLGGALTGVFVLAIFTRRTNAIGALTGAAAGTAVPLLVSYTTDVSPYLYGAIGVAVSVLVGYICSRFAGTTPANLDGLTLYTVREVAADSESRSR